MQNLFMHILEKIGKKFRKNEWNKEKFYCDKNTTDDNRGLLYNIGLCFIIYIAEVFGYILFIVYSRIPFIQWMITLSYKKNKA